PFAAPAAALPGFAGAGPEWRPRHPAAHLPGRESRDRKGQLYTPGPTHGLRKSLPAKELQFSVRAITNRKLFAARYLRIRCVCPPFPPRRRTLPSPTSPWDRDRLFDQSAPGAGSWEDGAGQNRPRLGNWLTRGGAAVG